MSEEKFYTKFTEQKKTTPKYKDKFAKNNQRKQSEKKEWSKTEKFHSSDFGNEKNKYFKTHKAFSYEKSGNLFGNNNLDETSTQILQEFDSFVQNIHPLNSKQIQQLPENIRNLSHQLTDERATRRLGYMNENVQLSSYVRYYTWWNLVRLTKLFSNLPEIALPDKDEICLDLGSGPLTVVIALWLSCPSLRNLKLTWYCLDVSQNSLSLGEDLYLSIASKYPDTNPWNIIRVKGSFGTEIRKKAGFITCANMLNELDQSSQMPPEFKTKQYFDQINKYSSDDARIILVEPGIPKSARTISLLRDRFISTSASILQPCTHCSECPMNGFKAYTGSQNKWCNFAFSTQDAPKKLLKMSELAKLPKDRAVLSFVSIQKNINKENSESKRINDFNSKKSTVLTVRITSDEFTLPGKMKGIYGCSETGLLLIRTRESLFVSGDELKINLSTEIANLENDFKSGAKIIDL